MISYYYIDQIIFVPAEFDRYRMRSFRKVFDKLIQPFRLVFNRIPGRFACPVDLPIRSIYERMSKITYAA